MTLDEAIEHAKQQANSANCKCAAEHLQLAEWLEHYKSLLKKEAIGRSEGDRINKHNRSA